MFTRTRNLFLRPVWPEDASAIFTAIGDESILRNLARAPCPYSITDAQSFANRLQDALYPDFLICLPTVHGGQLAGGCGLVKSDAGAVELGYWIAKPFWGRGYASEAAKAIAGIAHVIGHQRLVAAHFIDNPASGRVLQKTGFRTTGRTLRKFSAARGCRVASVEYAIDLDDMRTGVVQLAA